MTNSVKIIRASDAFAYLPLYMAEAYDLFELAQLPEHGGARHRTDFEFSSSRAATAGDPQAINAMLQSVAKGELAFALADPLEIFDSNFDDLADFIVLGAFLKKPPFWIVNGQEVGAIEDLNINNIIFYEHKTLKTGNYIGRYIAEMKGIRGSRVFPDIREVGQELPLLIEKKLGGLQNCGALTVDLLGMARAFYRSGPEKCIPVFKIFELPKFQRYLTSAFITHKQVLADAPGAVRALLAGIRAGVGMLRDELVVAKRCRELSGSAQFEGQLKLANGEHATPLTAREGLWVAQTIIASRLYTDDLSISLDDWVNASEGRWVLPHTGEMTSLYKAAVEPGNELAKELGNERKTKTQLTVNQGRAISPVDPAAAALDSYTRIVADSKRIVRHYLRWEARTINSLQDWVDEIKKGLGGKAGSISNFLFGGTSGSGKTYFVQEIAGDLNSSIEFIKIDFADTTEAQVRERLKLVKDATKPVLLMLDEIDTTSAAVAFYNDTFQLLEINETSQPRVCVLLGSAIGGHKGVVASLQSRPPKCCDMATRIPEENRDDIPDATLLDRLAVLAGQLEVLTKGPRQVEKFAVYYILTHPDLSNPRKMRDLIKPAVARWKKKGTKGLMYEDLFKPGAAVGRHFLADHRAKADAMAKLFIEFA